ncbi:MAG: hypothetical protein GY780_00340 [bacterium]|nr:hypothetical protein [bacterium]
MPWPSFFVPGSERMKLVGVNKGRPFTEGNETHALATRHLRDQLRDQGIMGGGPPLFSKKDRSLS